MSDDGDGLDDFLKKAQESSNKPWSEFKAPASPKKKMTEKPAKVQKASKAGALRESGEVNKPRGKHYTVYLFVYLAARVMSLVSKHPV